MAGANEANETNRRLVIWIPIVIAALGLLFGSGFLTEWWKSGQQESKAIVELKKEYLSPIQPLLDINKDIYDDLNDQYLLPGWGIQESYYYKVQSDGEESHKIMKARVDELVKNNDKIVMMIQKYHPHILTREFREQSKQFITHATRYNSRWPGVQAAALSGDEIPVAEPPFPSDFPAALQAEISASEKKAAR